MYVKLFGSILDSSIWTTDLATRVVWITMLAMADEFGIVHASETGLARRACVSLKECRRALKILTSADKDDRSGVANGRRIEPLQGAWQLINYQRYRELRSHKQVVDAARQARHRRDVSRKTVTRHDVTVEAEAEAEVGVVDRSSTRIDLGSTSIVAPKSATKDAVIAELRTLATTQHSNGTSRTAKVKLVFAYWAAKWDHPKTCLDTKRATRLSKRLQENHDNVSELLYVIDGSKRDSWDDRPRFAGIEQLFRDRGAVEKFAGLCSEYLGGTPHPLATKYGLAGGNGDLDGASERERQSIPAVARDAGVGEAPAVGTG